MSSHESVKHLLDLVTIRERCHQVSKSQLQFWSVQDGALPAVALYILKLIKRDYGTNYNSIRPHGRWSHFLVQGVDRISPLLGGAWKDVDELEKTRRMIDLTLVSVLLDAGAGTVWKYTETCKDRQPTTIGRSEGLAIASLDMFTAGLFSSSANKFQVDAKGLAIVTSKQITAHLQVSESNPMPGAQGRADLLIRLSAVLGAPENAIYFGNEQRPGNLLGKFG